MMKFETLEGYENTGIFARIAKQPDTIETNIQLKKMYQEWLDTFNDNVLNEFAFDKFNGIQYLTCTDSYLKKKARIMILGQEANSTDYKFKNYKKDFKEIYQHDKYYSYEYAISHPSETPVAHRPKTFYLSTRELICDYKECNPENTICSALVNNLNKTSFMGNHTPCFNGRKTRSKKYKDIYKLINAFDKSFYKKFSFNNLKDKNVFIHELNILRPTHLIFLCGKGYNNHIKRDFGESFFDIVKKNIYSLKINDTPVSAPVTIKREKIEELFGIHNYDSIKILFTIHPSSHMTIETRKKYNDAIEKFCKE